MNKEFNKLTTNQGVKLLTVILIGILGIATAVMVTITAYCANEGVFDSHNKAQILENTATDTKNSILFNYIAPGEPFHDLSEAEQQEILDAHNGAARIKQATTLVSWAFDNKTEVIILDMLLPALALVLLVFLLISAGRRRYRKDTYSEDSDESHSSQPKAASTNARISDQPDNEGEIAGWCSYRNSDGTSEMCGEERSAFGGEYVYEIHERAIDRIPVEVTLFLWIAASAVLIELMYIGLRILVFEFETWTMPLIGATIFLETVISCWACMSIAVKCKVHSCWRNSITRKLFVLTGRTLKAIVNVVVAAFKATPYIMKYVVVAGLITILLIVGICDEYVNVLPTIMVLALFVLGGKVSYDLKMLQRGSAEIAEGDLNAKVVVDKMLPVLKSIGKNLNSINVGVAKAVEEKMKSERLKTQLITNVSHDIKTPLTSIINYTELIKAEGLNSDNAPGYLEIIEVQANKLKKMTDDVVEASKASTGNIPVNISRCNVATVINQAVTEYEGKLSEAGLTAVIGNIPEDMAIMADGSLLWRIFGNLLSNVCRYALPGTRVYFNAEELKGSILITIKNIANYPLNVSGEELMERFVRGDVSRSGEGSGLGLSIVRSLVTLQGGVFEITIDGDLFKASMIFEKCE